MNPAPSLFHQAHTGAAHTPTVIHTELRTITPEAALALLESNTDNRRLSEPHVDFLANEMRSGRWQQNGSALVLSPTGRVLDGQHRLWAVVRSDTTHDFLIVHGVLDEAQTTVDTNRVRTAADALGMAGVASSHVTAGATRIAVNYAAGRYTALTSYKVSNGEVMAYVRAHPDLADSVRAAHSVKMGSPSVAAFVHYAAGHLNRPLRDSFFDGLATGLGLTEHAPAYLLRRVLEQHVTGARRRPPAQQLAYYIKAWNLQVKGTRAKLIRLGPDEVPTFHPQPNL